MPRRVPGAEIELLVRVRADEAKKRLIEIENAITRLKPVTQAAIKGTALIFGWFQGKLHTMQRWLKHFGQTLKSAVFRTIAYGIVNEWIKKPFQELKKSLKEVEELLLPTERAAVMMAEGGEKTTEIYKKMTRNLFTVRRNILAASRDISIMHQQFAKGGVRNIDVINRWSDVITKAGAITGENVNSMVRQFIQLKTALGVSDNQFGELVKTATVGTTMSMGTLDDLTGSVSRLAQTYNVLYTNAKDPLQILRDYVAVNMAVTKAGVKGVQVGTWMSTMLYRLLNPTKRMIDVMQRFGFQVYEAPTRRSQELLDRMTELSEASDKLRERKSELVEEESKLRILQERGVDVGDKLTKVTEERLEVESRLRRINELQRENFRQFLAAGGQVKLLTEIFQELHRRIKENTMTTNELAMLLGEAFGIRYMRGAMAGTAQAESMRKIFENLEYSVETFDKEWSKLLQMPATQVRAGQIAAQKLRDNIMAMVTVGFRAPVYTLFRENVLTPLSDALLKEDYWYKLGEEYKGIVTKIFEPLSKHVGRYLILTLFPKQLPEKLKKHREALREMELEKIYQYVMPVAKVIFSPILAIARKIGEHIGMGFMVTLNQIPFFRRFLGLHRIPREAAMELYRRVEETLPRGAHPWWKGTTGKWAAVSELAFKYIELARQGKITEIPREYRALAEEVVRKERLTGYRIRGFRILPEPTALAEKVVTDAKESFKAMIEANAEYIKGLEDVTNSIESYTDRAKRLIDELDRFIADLADKADKVKDKISKTTISSR